jgi:tetratricopeptide (TPR) repeat protein
MLTDLVLGLKPKGFFSSKVLISVQEPVADVGTPAGTLHNPPSNLSGLHSGYAKGVVDVEALARWIESSVGAPIVSLATRLYPTEPEDYLRVVMTCSDDLQAKFMTVPWELFELTGIKHTLPMFERLSLVRVLNVHAPPSEPTPAGDTIKIAVTWANPDDDIKGLDKHLENIRKLGTDYPRELSVLDAVEFTSMKSVRDAFFDQHPHVFYHIGHASQSSKRKVVLRIGPKGAPSEFDVEQFRSLLQVLGPPRLLLLNSCATTIGYSMNPYLGAALTCAAQIEAVITMQTMVPAASAMHFAIGLFRSLASGKGLADSMKRARLSIQRHETLAPVDGPSLTPFIPVLLQRTRLDSLFTVDISKREVRYLLALLKQQLERVEPYLERDQDPVIKQILISPTAGRRVTVVHGATGTGKSTSIRRIVFDLLTEDAFRAGHYTLYFEVQFQDLPSLDRDQRVVSLLVSLANLSPLTLGLKKQIAAARPRTAGEAIALLVTWLQEEHDYGREYSICLDNVPSDLVLEIAQPLSNILTDTGKFLLVTDDTDTKSPTSINLIAVQTMTNKEVEAALVRQQLSAEPESVNRILELSNGLPFLVAGYLRLPEYSLQKVDDLAEAFLRNVASALSEEEMEVLNFVSFCDISVPTPIVRKLAHGSTLAALEEKKKLLMRSEAGSYHVPTILRNALQQRFESKAVQTHQELFDRFNEAAEEKEDSKDEITFQLASRWLRESLRQGLSIMRRLGPEEAWQAWEATRDVANKLHWRYLTEGDDVGTATAMWQEYREVTNSLGLYDDRSSDTRYAECLMRLGQYGEADSLLEAVASSNEVDSIQLDALFLRSNLIKERGRRDEFPLRIELLRAALDVAHELGPPDVESGWIKQQTASLEHTLGNALGYGQNAKPDEALQHLAVAQRVFEELGSPLQFRTAAEQIEIQRYNHLLSEEQRQAAIATLETNTRRLLGRAMRYDAIRHFYELGRLEIQPEKRARWYEQAFKLAGNSYQPMNWHAGIKWRICQLEANLVQLQDMAEDLERLLLKLNTWTSNAWSRRVRRDAWQFLARAYQEKGDPEKALSASSQAWQAVMDISKVGQGQNDMVERKRIGAFHGLLALSRHERQLALQVAAELSEGQPHKFEHMSQIDLAAWFKTIGKEIT